MGDLQKYITKRKRMDKDFAKGYEEGFETFKTSKSFTVRANKGDWEKAREVLAKVLDTEAEDFDKL